MQSLQRQVPYHSPPFGEKSRSWIASLWLTVAVGVVYFLTARLSLALLTPTGVAVFWPAAGVAAGVLIALGSGVRLPVAAGAIGATICAHLLADDRFNWSAVIFALCNAAEPVIVAGLIAIYFGSTFSLARLRCVLGLVAAAIFGTAISGIGGAIGFALSKGSAAEIVIIWYHWVAADALGIITVAPMLIGVAAATRDPPHRNEISEGVAVLLALALLSAITIFLPRQFWANSISIALLLPILLWLAARCQPVFSAAAAFIIAFTIVCTTTFGIGIFGDASLSIDERVETAQAVILALSLCAFVLAALFSERRESEASLMRSNLMLNRERDNKLMNLEAMVASISHEVRQPLTAIATNGNAAKRFLGHTPPNLEEALLALDRLVAASHRASQVFDNLRALFGSTSQAHEPIDLNEIVLGTLRALHGELNIRGVTTHTNLASGLPHVMGHTGQLQEVIFNLAHNAIEAMDAVEAGSRVLQLTTRHDGPDVVAVVVQDTGPGIDPKKVDGIFEPFVSTKPKGMGLGLAICRMIIDRHNGRLTASSDGKHGALFEVVLPVKSTTDPSITSP